MRKVPIINLGKRVLIISEGYEEADYLNRLKECGVWNQSVRIDIKNAKSIDEIAARYEYDYQSGIYALIVVFCDTEKPPYQQFKSLKMELDKFHGNHASEAIVYFANPCTLQVVLSHFSDVKLKTNSKAGNADLIEKLTGVPDYKATERQRTSIMRKITADNYIEMKKNISKLSRDYTIVPSSNCLPLFDGLDGKTSAWIKGCNEEIEKE